MKCTFPFVSAALMLSFAVFSQQPDNMEVIYVTSERVARSTLHTPYSVEQFTAEDIDAGLYRSLPDIFKDAAGVMVQKTAYGQGSPYIRGFTGFRTLFLVDGVRLNNAIFREGPNQYWNTVDAFSVGRMELLRGPSSALYGADAIGGTVQVFSTRLDTDVYRSEQRIDYFYRGASAEHSNILRSSLRSEAAGQAFMAGVTLKDFGDLTRGRGIEQLNTGYDEYNLDAKWVRTLNEQWQLTAATFYTEQDDVPRTHRTIYSTSFGGTSLGNELRRDLSHKRFMGYARLSADKPFGVVSDLQVTLSWQSQQERRDRERTNNRYDAQGITTDTLGFQAQFTSEYADTSWVYGLESYIDSVDSFSTGNPVQGPVADDAQYQWHGLYLQGRTALTSGLDLLAGARFNHMRVDANKVSDPVTGDPIAIENRWSNTVFNLMLNYRQSTSQSFYAGISQGFRAPNLSDLTRFDSARSNEFEIPSTDLKAEHFTNYSLGYKFYQAEAMVDVSVFFTDIEDQIERFVTGNINADGEFEISKANIGDGHVKGLELRLGYAISKEFKGSVLAAYVSGKVDTFPGSKQQLTSEYPSRLMPTSVRFALDYEPVHQDWGGQMQWYLVERADRLSTRDMGDSQRIPQGGTPGYGVLNLSGFYQLSHKLRVRLEVENLFDKDYRIHGSGQNEAGRNFILGLQGSF
ncbi:TonB-dependent receptor [Lacimicrobium alkaliphilum]|uniref:TonB-dependent receptor n=1 Tax=Lacimicrobium alkaliphilum TaxID=1526571 RepID=A0ABQ1RAB8_9ALTE|nr:TonB-dependent receptor [Lacimicrobium alkaliphilum]GGD63043.1 hypothetical protein GCM10011357_17920 [Lacimicrobium alkaliphilum]